MTTMIERVAKALHEHGADTKFGYAWADACAEERARAEGFARAAIEAMRINTAEMCKAGRDAIEDAEIGISCGITIDYRSVACWQAMIDAALAEEAKP